MHTLPRVNQMASGKLLCEVRAQLGALLGVRGGRGGGRR